MAITAPPTTPVVNTAAAYCPHHLWLANGNAGGTSLLDMGKAASLQNLTLGFLGGASPTWVVDGTYGNVLRFLESAAQIAGVASSLGTTSGATMFAVVKIAAIPALNQTIMGFGDSTVNSRFYAGNLEPNTGPTLGRMHSIMRDAGTSYSNNSTGGVTDGTARLLVWKGSGTIAPAAGGGSMGRSSDGGAFVTNTIADAAFHWTPANLRFAIGGRVDSTPSNYASMDLIAAGVYVDTQLNDADMTNLFNGGDLWVPMGISEAPIGGGGTSGFPRGFNVGID